MRASGTGFELRRARKEGDPASVSPRGHSTEVFLSEGEGILKPEYGEQTSLARNIALVTCPPFWDQLDEGSITTKPPLYRVAAELLHDNQVMEWAEAKFMRRVLPVRAAP